MKPICLFSLLFLALVNGYSLDRNAFTFTGYDLDVQFDPAQQRMGVRGKIVIQNDSALPQKNLALQISSSLSWRSIRMGGKPLQFVSQIYTSDIDHTGALSEAIVALPEALPPRSSTEIEIGYEGVIAQDATRLTRRGAPKEAALHTEWDRIGPGFTVLRGAGYVAWYPIATEAASLSDADAVAQAIADFNQRERAARLLLNLCLLEDSDATHFLVNDPHHFSNTSGVRMKNQICSQHDFNPLGGITPTVIVGEVMSRMVNDSLEIDSLAGRLENAVVYQDAAQAVTPLITSWLGSPRRKSRVVELPDSEAASFESGGMLLMPFRTDARLAELVMAHQLAHSALDSPRFWIAEGLAKFAQALVLEKRDGRRAAQELLSAGLEAMVQAEDAGAPADDAHPSPPAAGGAAPAADHALTSQVDSTAARSKAAYVWWMLRDLVGDQALKNALARYQAADDNDPRYMQRLVQTQAQRDLGWFFADWVYHAPALPDFRVASVYSRKSERGFLVTVTVENAGGAGAQVPVTLQFEGGEVTRQIEVRGKSSGVIRIEAPAAPSQVVINDGSVPERDPTNNRFIIEAESK